MKKASHGKSNKSKWTPDISIDGAGSAGNARDDEIVKQMARKLGVNEDEVPEDFADDGLDYLVNIPKFGQEKKKKKAAKEEEEPVKKVEKRKKPIISKKKQEEEEEEDDDEDDDEVDMDDDDEDDEEEEEEVEQDPQAVLEALKKHKEQKTKNAKPPTEIDEIFGKLQEKKKPAKKAKTVSVAPSQKDDGFAGRSLGGGRKYTEEGFPIYTEEELKLNGKRGDTPDCPFDCNCCF